MKYTNREINTNSPHLADRLGVCHVMRYNVAISLAMKLQVEKRLCFPTGTTCAICLQTSATIEVPLTITRHLQDQKVFISNTLLKNFVTNIKLQLRVINRCDYPITIFITFNKQNF